MKNLSGESGLQECVEVTVLCGQPYLDLLTPNRRVAQQRLCRRRVDCYRLLRAAVFTAGLVAVPAPLPVKQKKS